MTVDSLTAVVGNGRDIDAAVANMLVAAVEMRTYLEGIFFHTKHIGTFLKKRVDGKAIMLGVVWCCG